MVVARERERQVELVRRLSTQIAGLYRANEAALLDAQHRAAALSLRVIGDVGSS